MAYQAAANEDDQLGQLSIAETLISQGFNGLLVSPQTDINKSWGSGWGVRLLDRLVADHYEG